jgi:hypothetical protein
VPLGGGNEAQVFRFRRDTVAASPAALAGTRVGSSSVTGNFIGVFSSLDSVPAQRTGGRIVNPDLVGGGRQLQVLIPSPTSTGAVRLTTDSGLGANLSQVRVDGLLETRTEAAALQVQASPLLGLRRVGTPAPRPFGVLPVVTLPDDDKPTKVDPTDPVTQAKVDPAKYRLSAGLGTSELYADQSPRVAPGLVIGQQLQLQIDPMRADESLDERVKRLEAALYSPLKDSTAVPGQDIYLDLLREMRNRGQESETEAEAPTPDEPATEEMTTFRQQLELPSEEEIEEAESERMAALRKAYGLDFGRDEPSGETDGDEPDEDEARGLAPKQRQGLEALVKQLDYDPAPLETLAGRRESRINDLLQKAEGDLAAGRYFAAESRYAQALSHAPKEPLIRAGLVNAQLGAGMIRSAAHNLRLHYERHPELIAARYGEKLLPSPDRLKWVQGELQNMIHNPTSTADPGLMMAYLGYQVESRQLIRYGLAVAEARSPKDPLLPLLRRIWLDEKHQAPRDEVK